MTLLIGCDSGNKSPTLPNSETNGGSNPGDFRDTEQTNRAIWGLWEFRIPEDHSTIEVVPVRLGAGHLNVRHWLEGGLCNDCLYIENAQLQPGNVFYFSLNLKNPYLSPTFTGFDVRGIFISNSDSYFPEADVHVNLDFNIPPASPVLLNMDGWTRLFNPTEFPEDSGQLKALKYTRGWHADDQDFTSTLNPFIAFNTDQPRRLFPAASGSMEEIRLRVPDGALKMGYAIDASWMPPTITPVEDPVTDFPPDANCPEPYRIIVTQGLGLNKNTGASCKVTVKTYDWQDPLQLSSVTLECPDVFSGTVDAVFSAVQGEGVIFEAEVFNETGVGKGRYPCLITAWDQDFDAQLGEVKAYQGFLLKVTNTGIPFTDIVDVPGGEFMMGCHESEMWCAPHVIPQHLHPVDAFSITVFKVRTSEFMAFMNAGGMFNELLWSDDGWEWRNANCPDGIPGGWNYSWFGEDYPDHPACVHYYVAEAFCNWVGGRLPTEAEWEYVAGGSHGLLYPWGNEWGPAYVDCPSEECAGYIGHPYPVDRWYPDDLSPYGVSGMVSVWQEFCVEMYDAEIYEQYATGDFTPPNPSEFHGWIARGDNDGASNKGLAPEFWYVFNRWGQSGAAFRVVFDP